MIWVSQWMEVFLPGWTLRKGRSRKSKQYEPSCRGGGGVGVYKKCLSVIGSPHTNFYSLNFSGPDRLHDKASVFMSQIRNWAKTVLKSLPVLPFHDLNPSEIHPLSTTNACNSQFPIFTKQSFPHNTGFKGFRALHSQSPSALPL